MHNEEWPTGFQLGSYQVPDLANNKQQQLFILTRLFFPVYWVDRLWPSHNIFLHLHLSQASSLQSSFSLIFSQHFSPSLLGSTFHSITIYLQCLNSLYHLSTWPNHLNLFCHMTSAMSSIASMFLTHSLLFLSLKLTPVIHLNILIPLCIFLILSTFVGHVSLPYNITGLMHVV